MKVLHVSGARSWGGNEQQLADLIPELKKLQIDNIIFGIRDSPLHKHFKNTSLTFLTGKEKKISGRSNFLLLKKVIRDYQPSVLHLHTSDSVTLFVIADLLYNLKIPAVFSKKGMSNSSTFLSLYKYNYKNINKIICVSVAVKENMKEILKSSNYSKLTVVYDGVNLDRTKIIRREKIRKLFKINRDVTLLGNIANHAKAKDLGVLINMMDYLINYLEFKDVHLIQIGQFSKLTEDLKQQIVRLNLTSFITFTGFQDHALDFISQFDIYVMSSEREGLPITIFEAFYKRCPVVSTRAGGIPEAISDGENGFLVNVKDHKGLAEKVALLAGNKELEDQFARNAERIFYERFVANITAKETVKIYKEVATL